jgi:transcriptional regulator with XRE-family HTH domain
MDSLGARLRKAREDAGLSQSAIAKELGITRNAVSLWESDDNAPTTDKIGRIAVLTGASVEYLLSGREPKSVPKHEIPHPLEMPRDVPVLGIAACGEDGAFVFESTTIDFIRRPPRLKGIPDVYAIYVQGHSMSPWREPGSSVYVHPKQQPQVGDYVVVQTGAGWEGFSRLYQALSQAHGHGSPPKTVRSA